MRWHNLTSRGYQKLVQNEQADTDLFCMFEAAVIDFIFTENESALLYKDGETG